MRTEYRILGPLEALVDGRPAKLGGPRPRGVLALLLVQANTLVPAGRLVDSLWPDGPPATAENLVQGYVSDLRKALGREAIETRGSGYILHVRPDMLDLHRFERLADAGSAALADGRHGEAAAGLRKALDCWSGPPLADLDGETYLDWVVARLAELRLLALERRIEADLGLGRHADVAGELEALVREHPLRERPRGLLMLALYGAGRQAEALETYRAARQTFIDELGIEPGEWLRELEVSMLRQDPGLARGARSAPGVGAAPTRSVMATSFDVATLDPVVSMALDLAREPLRELLLVRTVASGSELAAESIRLRALPLVAAEVHVAVRTAAFTSLTPGHDLARVAAVHDVDLMLVDAPAGLLEDARLLALLDQCPCDVGVLVGGHAGGGPVLVPFTGADHDWAAVELGAWLARNTGSPLQLAGATTGAEGRDASRLLASASLVVQRGLGVAAEPRLVDPSPDALVSAAADAGIVVVGLTDRWRRDGLGRVRSALATVAAAPTVLVRRGVRPGGLAPRASETRFTWTIGPGGL